MFPYDEGSILNIEVPVLYSLIEYKNQKWYKFCDGMNWKKTLQTNNNYFLKILYKK